MAVRATFTQLTRPAVLCFANRINYRRTSVACMASAAMPPARYHILTYQYVPDIVEKRGPYREAHIAAAKSKLDAGILVMAGMPSIKCLPAVGTADSHLPMERAKLHTCRCK